MSIFPNLIRPSFILSTSLVLSLVVSTTEKEILFISSLQIVSLVSSLDQIESIVDPRRVANIPCVSDAAHEVLRTVWLSNRK